MRAASPERQVTLGAIPTFHLPDLTGVAEGVIAGPEREARLETTYYDTVDVRLARWGVSLSHRGDHWTLVIPNGRGASELGYEGAGRRPPDEALALIRAYLRGAALEPVARLSSWRRQVPLLTGPATSSPRSSTTRSRCSTAGGSPLGSGRSRWTWARAATSC